MLDRTRLPLLITGISGVAGYNALPYFHARYGHDVHAIRQVDNWRLLGPGVVACDAEDEETLARLFDRFGFRAVLDTAGNCALKSCELNPAMARRVNVEGVRTLLNVMRGRDVRLVHLSIDLVYGGASDGVRQGRGGHVETDLPDPVTEYGKSMIEAEALIAAEDPRACTLRISLPMGISFNGHAGAIDWIQSRFKKGKPATLYFDEVRTPTFTDDLNELCELVLAGELNGLYHAGGPRRLSLYEIAQVVNRVGGYDPDLLIGMPRIDAGPMPPRAGDVTLDSSKLAALIGVERFPHGPFDAWPYEERWTPTHRRWHYERDEEPGSADLIERILYRNPRRGLHVPPRDFYHAARAIAAH
ncbi:MAG: sugar nucleotide-binding protein [Pirellulales bacterium]